ncbi:MAG: DUF805 domain-containing protein [Clostridium sp.]
MSWYILRWKRTLDFKGRSRRKEYWMSFLFDVIILIALTVLGSFIGLGEILPWIYSVAIIVPNLSCTIRRIHDIGKSGYFILMLAPTYIFQILEAFGLSMGVTSGSLEIFLIGGYLVAAGCCLTIFVFTFINGQSGDNKYGIDPKAEDRIIESI